MGQAYKGVQQGSITGPVLFNIFINDIFYSIEKTNLYNYADDNTISYSHKNYTTMKRTLEADGSALVDWFTINQMQANPGKFQGLAVGTKTHAMRPTFNIKGADIECTDETKLLGITFDYKLNFDSHISTLTKKIGRQINVLKRIGQYLPISCRKTIYQCFIKSNFNFCPIIWHFCSAANTKKLERLNYRALRLVYKDYTSSYESLLAVDGSVSLHLRRQRMIAEEVYKILGKQSPSYLQHLIKIKDTPHNLRHKNVQVDHFHTKTYGKKSFSYEASKIWNDLPNHIREAKNFKTFRKLLDTWGGVQCKCAICSF